MRVGTLLLALSGLLIGTTLVQAQQTPVTKPNKNIVRTLDHADFNQRAFDGTEVARDAKNGTLPGASSLIEGADSLFSTGYDFQTNAAMPRRIINWGRDGVSPTGIASTFIYMAAPGLFPNTPGRGTYGSVLGDFGGDREWLPLNFDTYDRLEGSRSGFCDIDYFKSGDFAGQVVAVSHANDLSLVNLILETDAPGSGQYLVIPVGGSDGGLWPRVAVDDQNNIHLIWTYQGLGGTPDGREGIMAYTRSTDQGTTWEPVINFTAARTGNTDPNALQSLTGGDSYQIDANGSSVAIWYMSTSVNLIQLYHPDYGDRTGGVLWQPSVIAAPRYRNRFSEHSDPDSVYYNDPQYEGTDTTGFVSDTVETPGSSFDMMVMDDGSIAGAYPEFPSYVTRFTVGTVDTTQTTYLSGLIQQGTLPAYTDRSLRFVHITPDDEVGLIFNQSSLVRAPDGLDFEGEFFGPRGFGTYLGRWPQMAIGSNGDHFILFGSGKENDWVTEDVNGTNRNFYRSHTYAVRSTNSGASWTTPQDLTPDGVDAQFASIGMWVDDEAHIVLQTDTYPGDLVTSADAETGLGLHPVVTSSIEAMVLPSAAFAPSSAEDELRVYGTTAINSVSPNPATDNVTLSYTVGKSSDVQLEIVDASGKTVRHFFDGRRVAGTYSMMTSVADLASGQYHLVLTVDGASKTMPINVVR